MYSGVPCIFGTADLVGGSVSITAQTKIGCCVRKTEEAPKPGGGAGGYPWGAVGHASRGNICAQATEKRMYGRRRQQRGREVEGGEAVLLVLIVPGGVLATGGLHSSREGQRADHRAESASEDALCRRSEGRALCIRQKETRKYPCTVYRRITEQRSMQSPYPLPKHFLSTSHSPSKQVKSPKRACWSTLSHTKPGGWCANVPCCSRHTLYRIHVRGYSLTWPNVLDIRTHSGTSGIRASRPRHRLSMLGTSQVAHPSG